MSNFSGYIKGKLKQTATYWEPLNKNGYGEQTFKSPVIIKCRWEDVNELVMSKTGELINSKSLVYTTEVIDLNGYLALGDFTTEPDPKNVSNACEVKRIETSVSVNGRVYFRKVYL